MAPKFNFQAAIRNSIEQDLTVEQRNQMDQEFQDMLNQQQDTVSQAEIPGQAVGEVGECESESEVSEVFVDPSDGKRLFKYQTSSGEVKVEGFVVDRIQGLPHVLTSYGCYQVDADFLRSNNILYLAHSCHDYSSDASESEDLTADAIEATYTRMMNPSSTTTSMDIPVPFSGHAFKLHDIPSSTKDIATGTDSASLVHHDISDEAPSSSTDIPRFAKAKAKAKVKEDEADITVNVQVLIPGKLPREVRVVVNPKSTAASLRMKVGEEVEMDVQAVKKLAIRFGETIITLNPGRQLKSFGIRDESFMKASVSGFGGGKTVKKDVMMKQAMIIEKQTKLLSTAARVKPEKCDNGKTIVEEAGKRMTTLYNLSDKNPKQVIKYLLQNVSDQTLGTVEESPLLIDAFSSGKVDYRLDAIYTLVMPDNFVKLYDFKDEIGAMMETAYITFEFIMHQAYLSDTGVWSWGDFKSDIKAEMIRRTPVAELGDAQM